MSVVARLFTFSLYVIACTGWTDEISPVTQPAQLDNPVARVVSVGDFTEISTNNFEPWRIVHLDDDVPATIFEKREWSGVTAIVAKANRSMSLLARPITVDLMQTPVLCWAWRVEGVLTDARLGTKAGDDYAARIYVGLRDTLSRPNWFERAAQSLAKKRFGDTVPDYSLNYVWDNLQPIGTHQANAYTERSQLWVVAQGGDHIGQWVGMRQNVRQDVDQAFKGAFKSSSTIASDRLIPVLLAITSDTDNTGENMLAGFAQLHFVSDDAPCAFSPPLPLISELK